MARDLSFWKYEGKNAYVHSEVYARLSDSETVPGIETLPIDEIRVHLDTVFSSWVKPDKCHYECNGQIIEVFTTDQFVRFDCYCVSEENMNKLIDIMLAYDCKLYDSAIDVRFD